MTVKELTKRAEVLFKQTKSLDADEYAHLMQNLELLKIKYFRTKHKDNSIDLLEVKLTFKEFVEILTSKENLI